MNITNDPRCSCGAKCEDAIHYLLECPLYQNERRILISELEDIDIDIETLLFGNDDYSIQTNSRIFEKVRTFMKYSRRF